MFHSGDTQHKIAGLSRAPAHGAYGDSLIIPAWDDGAICVISFEAHENPAMIEGGGCLHV